jgi:lysophospholipase L1-like esterase
MEVRAKGAAVVVGLLALGVLSGCAGRPQDANTLGAVGGDSPSPQRQAAFAPYVALGDSYTAGPRIPDQEGKPSGCRRSSSNYPSVVAGQLGLSGSDFTDASCSGATAAEIASGERQRTRGGPAGPQLDALSSRTKLVTVGAGGNDVAYFGVLETCARLGIAATALGDVGAGAAPCRDHYGGSGLDGRMEQAGTVLGDLLQAVRDRAPKARVLVVGYPAIFPSHGGGCGSLLLTGGDLAYVRGLEQELNAELRQQALAAGDQYVDTYGPSVGHDACEAADDRWVEPLLPSRDASPLHPNSAGEAGMASAVLAVLRAHTS